MKALLRLTLGLMIGIVVLAACNDDDETQTTLQNLQHVWLVDSSTFRSVAPGSDLTISTPGTAADFYDFRTDGKLYYHFGTDPDTLNYTLVSDTKLVINGDTANIETLTNNKLVYTTTIYPNATDYNVTKLYLRR